MILGSICGNHHAKRAVEVSLAGHHSIQFIGPWQSQAQEFAKYMFYNGYSGTMARALTPCPCGWYNSERECTCSTSMVSRWQTEHFGDRVDFDITIYIPEDSPEVVMDWLTGNGRPEPEEAMWERINGQAKFESLALDSGCEQLLRAAVKTLHLSYYASKRVLRVARTIANLAQSEPIRTPHIAEAIQYRPRSYT